MVRWRAADRSVAGGGFVDFADCMNIFVKELDASGLGEEGLAHREWQVLFERLGIGPGGGELVVLSNRKQRLITAIQFGFELSPYAIDGGGKGAFFNVVDGMVVKDGLKAVAIFCAGFRLFKEVLLEKGVVD